ncbi:MAG TPA: Fur family transcriptional regulator [Gammaproteobacteria bacterium]|nr:Fur family transcriptional regulator [Gammaproteobacteria bacterium]
MANQADKQPLSGERVNELLRQHGILPTQQRLLIASVLLEREQHLSADQVMNLVNGEQHLVSKATVYNTLGLFANHGLIREVIVDPARVFYDSNTSDHHHFYNVDTGELTDIDSHTMELAALPEMPAGTVAAGVDIIIRVRRAATPR